MRRTGRPLRFLAVTLGGWVAVRIAILWPTIDSPRALIRALAPSAMAETIARPSGKPKFPTPMPPPPPGPKAATSSLPVAATAIGPDYPPPSGAAPDAPVVDEDRAIDRTGVLAPPLRPAPIDPPRRLTASLWGVVRQGTDGTLPGGQLGGSQAGVRITYALDTAQRIALAARVSTPLSGLGREAAIGVEYRPAHLPLRFVAERRIALDAARYGTAFYAIGGLAPTPVAAGLKLEGYAQAGVVLRDGTQGFADAATRLTRALTRSVDIGVGAWGGIQPGTARVDVGPTIGVALPVAGRTVRVSADWRHRIAGRAHPGSGPALSIGSDF